MFFMSWNLLLDERTATKIIKVNKFTETAMNIRMI